MSGGSPVIEIKNLTKTFPSADGTFYALKNVSLTINDGEIYGIIGMSGAGKSTLVRCINMLERPTEGAVLVNGCDVGTLRESELRKTRREVTMIFQGFHLLMQRTVLRNVTFPLELHGTPKKQAEARALELLELVGLSGKANNYPSQLSGGQQQRVAIARALASNPKIMLCDEATSALDTLTTHSILGLLRDINKELGVTMVVITHSLSVAEQICNKVAVIEAGSIAEQGKTADVFGNPQSAATRLLIEADQGFACAKGGN